MGVTYHLKKRKRKRTHGFLKRAKKKPGRRILQRRRKKKRTRLAA